MTVPITLPQPQALLSFSSMIITILPINLPRSYAVAPWHNNYSLCTIIIVHVMTVPITLPLPRHSYNFPPGSPPSNPSTYSAPPQALLSFSSMITTTLQIHLPRSSQGTPIIFFHDHNHPTHQLTPLLTQALLSFSSMVTRSLHINLHRSSPGTPISFLHDHHHPTHQPTPLLSRHSYHFPP